uniref:Cadherin domain-containing protein n=1 Tax=Romanomermis culicivorax TaxID=13658 RepID=A0A915KTX4_ROMCU
TGEIFAAEPLNRDPPNGIDRWNLVVQAIDDYGRGLVGYADVQVLLTDINDNAPVFGAGPNIGYVMENQDITDSIGVYVKTMIASDNDDPRSPNSKL